MDDRLMKSVEFEMIKDIIILHLDGEMNTCGIMNFEGILEDIMDRKPITIAVDCSKLFVLDPATISQLVKYLKKARSNNIELVLYNINPEVLMTIELMKLNGFFTLVSGEQFEKQYINNSMLN